MCELFSTENTAGKKLSAFVLHVIDEIFSCDLLTN